MTNETEEKIIDASLNVFSEKGYNGATTMAISEESGFTERTLFRKFKTKENLFNTTITKKGQEMMESFEKSVLVDKEFENPKDFMDSLIRNIRKVGDHHFAFFHLSISERSRIPEPIMQEFNYKLSMYIAKHIPGQKIDYMTFGLTISAFLYMIITEKYLGRTAIDLDVVLEKFIDNCLACIR